MSKILTLDNEWGGVIRTVLIIVALGLLALADQRYFTKQEAQASEIRIEAKFEKFESLIGNNAENYTLVLDRLGRIEAQNEIILDHLRERHEDR